MDYGVCTGQELCWEGCGKIASDGRGAKLKILGTIGKGEALSAILLCLSGILQIRWNCSKIWEI